MNKKYIEIDQNNKVVFVHHMPFDPIDGMHMTEEQLLQRGGKFVDNIPEADNNGMLATWYYDDITNSVHVEYTEIITPEQRIAQLEQLVADQNIAIAQLLGM